HLQVIGLDLVAGALELLLHLLHLGQDPEHVLDVVTDLVGDHVGLRELACLAAAAAEAVLQVAEERRVEIDALVAGTVERPHGGLRHAAARLLGDARIHDQLGRTVGLVAALEDLLPAVLHVAEHGGDELPFLVLGRAGLARPGLVSRPLVARSAAGQDLGAADQEARIDPQRPPDEPEHHDRPDAQAAATARHAEAATAAFLAAAILDVVAAAEIVPTHLRTLLWAGIVADGIARVHRGARARSSGPGTNAQARAIVSIWLPRTRSATSTFYAQLKPFFTLARHHRHQSVVRYPRLRPRSLRSEF